MRETFHAELENLISDLARTCRMTGQMIVNASDALQRADLALAETVIVSDEAINTLRDDMEERCVKLLALQAPVASDLRVIIAALNSIADLSRMGDLAQHIAKIARLKHPETAVASDVRPVFARMSLLARELADGAAAAIEERDAFGSQRLEEADDEVDALRRRLFHIIFDDSWSHGVEPAVDAALIGRYYERFADHAVAIARQVSYLVTGELPLEQEA